MIETGKNQMRRLAALALAAALSAGTALAEDAPKLTLAQCINISGALRAFDGYTGVDKDGKSAPMQYKLGDLRRPIYLAQAALETLIKSNDAVRMDLVRQHLPNGTPPAGTPEYDKFMATDPGARKFTEEWQARLNKTVDLVLPRLKWEDLNVGDPPAKNPVPPSVLSALDPIIDR